MSNTIEDLIRDIIHYETEEAREDMNIDYFVDALQKLEKRIEVLEQKLKE